VDIDWEVPATAADGANCTLMMQAIRARMPSPWIVSMAIPALPANWTTYNVPALIGSLDWVNVMTYDFNEGISNYTGHVSPEFQSPADTQSLGSLKTAIDWYAAQGVPLSKLNAGMAFYGYYYPNATAPWQNCTNCDPVYEFYGTYIKPKINAGGWTDNIETASDSRYLTSASPSGFITYDSASSIADKVTYSLATRGMGGVFMWELSEDYDGTSQDLLTSMYNAFSAQCGNDATATSTPAFTPTKTKTATYTVTWTNTQTVTFTVTSTNIPSKTPVNTFTNTPDATATWTPTRTITTISSPASTSTAAPTLTGTQTFTCSQTPGMTSTCTVTATPAGTKISSATVTAVSTYTFTSTATYTETNIINGTSTDTATNTGTFTMTLTPIWTMTPTATASFSSSFIPSETPSAVSTATAIFTATPSFTAALTNSSTAVFSATDTASFTFTPTTAVTSTPTAGEGDKLEIQDTFLYPNPNYGSLDKGVRVRFSLTKDADTLKFILYTVNFRKVRETEFAAGDISGGMKRGGNEAPIDGKYFNNLANGSYYYFLQAKNYQGESARSIIKPLIIIH
jgi:hypothetical protein